jgi:hypothetical protein
MHETGTPDPLCSEFDGNASVEYRVNATAQSVASFNQCDLYTSVKQTSGRCEAGQAGPDNDHMHRRRR